MKNLAIMLLFSTYVANCFSQKIEYPSRNDSSVIQIASLYNGKGKILSDLKSSDVTDFKNRRIFIPTDGDLLNTEKILNANYVSIMQKASFNGTLIDKGIRDYYRQYITFKDQSGNKKIYVLLFKCCYGNIRTCFPKWASQSVFIIHGDSCSPVYGFLIDLNTSKIELINRTKELCNNIAGYPCQLLTAN